MKLAQINLARGLFIPGIGNASKLENMECENAPGGILVTTPAAKVLIPWERVDSVVTEWIHLTVSAGSGGKNTGAAVAAAIAHGERTAEMLAPGAPLKEALEAGAKAILAPRPNGPPIEIVSPTEYERRANLQPAPPQKKGGRK